MTLGESDKWCYVRMTVLMGGLSMFFPSSMLERVPGYWNYKLRTINSTNMPINGTTPLLDFEIGAFRSV